MGHYVYLFILRGTSDTIINLLLWVTIFFEAKLKGRGELVR